MRYYWYYIIYIYWVWWCLVNPYLSNIWKASAAERLWTLPKSVRAHQLDSYPKTRLTKHVQKKYLSLQCVFSPSMSCENLDNAKPPETNFRPYQPTCLVLYPFSGWICWTFTIVVDELHNVTPWFHPNEFVWSIPKSFNLESFIILFPVFRSPFEAQFVAKAQNLVGDPNLLPVKSCQIHEGRTSLV